MDYTSAMHKLHGIEQQHILQYWDLLDTKEQDYLLHQIALLDIELFRLQRKLLQEKHGARIGQCEPVSQLFFSGNENDRLLGREKLREGKVGALVVAGGQGTRLGYDGPKGEVPVSVIRHKSLFQLIAEKTLAASHQAGVPLSLAIMTSPLNHWQTVDFFRRNDNFGLDPKQIDFFQQEMLPLLDQKGDLFLEQKGKIAEGPDGNGTSLKHFVRSGIWDRWHARGIEHLNYLLVDNAMADPFDSELIGYHCRKGDEVTIKCIAREDPKESVGVIVRSGDKVRVVEYTEISDNERLAKNPDGTLKHRCANISLFALKMDFVQNIGMEVDDLMPYHLALKAVHYLNAAGDSVKAVRPIAWKFEKYIFDFLPLTRSVGVIIYPREECFASLKNAEGSDSIATVQQALQESDRRVARLVTGVEPPEGPFELAQQFYYPTPEILKQWKGKAIPSNQYVEVK